MSHHAEVNQPVVQHRQRGAVRSLRGDRSSVFAADGGCCRGRLRGLLLVAVSVAVLLLACAPGAHAGTYVIDNCPSAGNGNAGAWSIFGSPQGAKATCAGGEGDYIGPRGASMSPDSTAGVRISVPAGSGITITEAKVWWQVSHQLSGADTFAIAATNDGAVAESGTPLTASLPSIFVLPSTTTELTLSSYCSNDDAGAGCTFGEGENNILELYGAQLTLNDTTLPSGTVTGGALAGSATVSGTASIGYRAADASSGVRGVQLLIDGQPATEKSYTSGCSYTTFQACPASVSDTIAWNTATVADGKHAVELVVEDAAQNTSVIYDATISTENAPAASTAPSILTPGQVTVGSALSSQPGKWSAPQGAGPISYAYQWQDCNSEGEACKAIPDATSASYTPAPSDIGRTLRLRVSATDNDGAGSETSPATPVVGAAAGSLGAQPGPGATPTTPAGSTIPAGGKPGAAASTASAAATAAARAVLRLGVHHRIIRSFAHRAIKHLKGRLLEASGHPIRRARLLVLERIGPHGKLRVIGHARTGVDGAFRAHVPGGPSRLIEVAYRAGAHEAGFAAVAKLHETVRAGVRLRISPRATTSTGTILLKGRVLGRVPRHGVQVDLLVHYRGRWEPFRTTRTDSNGRFTVAYQFQGATGRFPFRAVIPASQARFAFARGVSETVDVQTR